jgi:hypothetical protein
MLMFATAAPRWSMPSCTTKIKLERCNNLMYARHGASSLRWTLSLLHFSLSNSAMCFLHAGPCLSAGLFAPGAGSGPNRFGGHNTNVSLASIRPSGTLVELQIENSFAWMYDCHGTYGPPSIAIPCTERFVSLYPCMSLRNDNFLLWVWW